MKGRRVLLGLVSGDEGKKSRLLWLSVVQAGVGRQPRRVLCHCLRVSKGTPRGANHRWPGRQCAYFLSWGLPLPFSYDLPVLVLTSGALVGQEESLSHVRQALQGNCSVS